MNDQTNPAQPMQPTGVAPMATPDPVTPVVSAMPEPVVPPMEPVVSTPAEPVAPNDAPVMPQPMGAAPVMPSEPVVTTTTPVVTETVVEKIDTPMVGNQ